MNSAPSQRWTAATLALAGAGLVLLFAVVPHGLSGDGLVRYLKLDALLREGTLAGDRYSYVGPLFASPFWMLGESRIWWCERFNVLVLAAGSAAAWWALHGALPGEERASSILLLGTAGMMPHATRDFYGELFSAVAIGTGLIVITTAGISRRWPGWVAIVLGVANMPGAAGGLLLVALVRIWRQRRFDGLVALLLALGIVLLENTIMRGHPLHAGYVGDRGAVTVMPYSGIPGFSYPLVFGIPSLLLSFGKGLFFFAPGLLLVAGARRIRPEIAPFLELSVVFLAGLVLVYSQWWAWYGGWTWGPRFLLFAAYPSSIALAAALAAPARWPRHLAVAAVACWTVWVGVSGIVFGLRGLDACVANGYALEHLCWYVPDYSPLFRPLVLTPGPLAPWQEAWIVFAALVLAVLITSGPLLVDLARGIPSFVLPFVPSVLRRARRSTDTAASRSVSAQVTS